VFAITGVAQVSVLAWLTETSNPLLKFRQKPPRAPPKEAQLWGPLEKKGVLLD
jgi:hypothetical protein